MKNYIYITICSLYLLELNVISIINQYKICFYINNLLASDFQICITRKSKLHIHKYSYNLELGLIKIKTNFDV